jgi:hypothetical protein
MVHLMQQPDFTLVIPGLDGAEWVRSMMELGREANRAYLDALAELPTGGRITGSFIYAHPPDYVGRPTMATA